MKFYNLTSIQKSIWISQQIYLESPMFAIGGYTILKENIHILSFKRAFERLVKQHVALRIAFKYDDGFNVLQYVDEVVNSEMEYLDFSKQIDSESVCMDW